MTTEQQSTVTFRVPGVSMYFEVHGAMTPERIAEDFKQAREMFEDAIANHGMMVGSVASELMSAMSSAYAYGREVVLPLCSDCNHDHVNGYSNKVEGGCTDFMPGEDDGNPGPPCECIAYVFRGLPEEPSVSENELPF